MQQVSDFLTLLDSFLGSSTWFVFFLLGTGIFFTIYLKFPQIRFFRHAIDIVRGKFDKKDDKGDTSHFGALTTALSGTVGTGNIAGVALAIHLGGPSAVFWMLMTAFLGMTTKLVEVTLSHRYREVAQDGTIAGGPMYYMKNRLKMKPLAALFAIATIFSAFGTGNFPQINSIANSFEATFGVDKIIMGVILAALLSLVILGGIKRIAKVTENLVPIMTLLYFAGAISVLVSNIDSVVPSVTSIFSDVFNGTSAVGGFLGAGFTLAFNRGVNRGLFSNEAGQGSAPIAHAAARTEEPVSEGLVSILEPFIDTIIVCFFTAIVLLSSGVWSEKHDNTFQYADLKIVENVYVDSNKENVESLSLYLKGDKSSGVNSYNGSLNVVDGQITNSDITLLHARSIASNVVVTDKGEPFNGNINVVNGVVNNEKYSFTGKSLLHSAPLTTLAFGKGVLGGFGSYIIPICLLLFAFSTAIAWSYYGDRAVTYLFGSKYVTPFRVLYIIAFFFGAFLDTTLLWIFSSVTVAFMAIPNLFGILLLRKDMKKELSDYESRLKSGEISKEVRD
ncbi:MAG: sodium:alanine symporter family protein [Rikenellaceae bacterium]